ncbi:MAG TPA: N-acetylmuramoyl-L-alanine amidase, partial [Polyangia bacterium]|nr:N-acetylmuramoyl-L-alanine amidase [Polyangia bacterium]
MGVLWPAIATLLQSVLATSAPAPRALAAPVVSRPGALAGKTIYLAPGQGFLYDPAAGRWRTQSGASFGLVGDLESVESVSGWLIPYLLAAGADVVPLRETDLGTDMVIVDDSDAGSYVERGDPAKFHNGPGPAFGHYTVPLRGAQNPFLLGQSRLLQTTLSETARAVYAPALPRSGFYNVYVSYVADPSRATDAHYIVHHDGGDTDLRVNQQRHGGTWVFLGRFHFWAGGGGSVALVNDSKTGVTVSADAVRFGAGLGDRAEDACACASGRPRADEAAAYYAQFAGAPMAVWSAGDQAARARMAAWVHTCGEDAVYLSWQSNARDGLARGTETFIYGDNPPNGSFTPRASAGSDRLGALVHAALIRALRADWDPSWNDRHLQSANFAELSPVDNPDMPAIRVQVAFRDQPDDAAALHEPHFRRIAARAIVQGIIQFFAEQASETVLLPPEPPTHLAARTVAPGKLALTWSLPARDPAGGDLPTGYQVYSSEDGLSFNNGQFVGASPLIVDLAPGQLRFFRVASRNAAGVSLPSRVVGALMGRNARSRALVMIDFDRLDATALTAEDDSGLGIGTVQRMFLERANDGTYARLHGDALGSWPLAFDSATSDAAVALGDYEFVDWVAGRNNRLDAAVSARLVSFQAGGGKLLVTGTDFIKAAGSNV